MAVVWARVSARVGIGEHAGGVGHDQMRAVRFERDAALNQFGNKGLSGGHQSTSVAFRVAGVAWSAFVPFLSPPHPEEPDRG